MSFLSGMFLLALPLAAVPVVLHLYRRRQRVVVPWGAMQFLTDAAKQGRRRERWEEILLMILRTAAVLALVFALARPQLSGDWFGERPTREVILVLDNSMSMDREVAGETPFGDLVSKAGDVLDELNSGDAIQVMTAVGGPQWMTSESIRVTAAARTKLLAQIQSLAPTNGAADLYSCVQASLAVEPADGARARHVVILSDGQAHGWQADNLATWRRLKDLLESSELPTTLQSITCGFTEEPPDNVAVVAMEESHTQVGVGEEVTLRTDIRNVGETATSDTTLQWLENGEPLDELDVAALGIGESTSVQWKWRAAKPGIYALSCRLQTEDQLLRDNEGSVIVEVVETIPVLIVETPAEYRQRFDESTFVTAALGYERETPREGWHSLFSPHIVPVDELAQTPLNDYRAIIITDAAPAVSENIERLRDFVERGGGLWVALGKRADRESFNAVWYDDAVGLSPLPLSELATHVGDGEQEAVIHPPSANHVATAQLADTNRLDIDAVRIKARHRFEPELPGQDVSVILETGDGEPLVVENYLGRGRVLIQAVPFDVSWSNLPITKSFVVMVHDWLDYLTRPAATQFNLAAGGQIEVAPPAASAATSAAIQLPDGSSRPLALREAGDGFAFRYSQTHVPGRYEVRLDAADAAEAAVPFEVARDAAESELKALTDDQRAGLTQDAGLQFPQEFSDLVPVSAGGRADKPVWNALLAAVLILLVGETLLAARAARRRTPTASFASSLEAEGGPLAKPTMQTVREGR